jgi:hypothetical protein
VGLLSWLFPTPEVYVARARAHLAAGRPEFARLEVLDLDRDDARAILAEAENQLAVRNLEAAVQYTRQREDTKAGECLELAEQFHHGGLEQMFQDVRRELREVRAERSSDDERKAADKQARLLAVDPLGMSGGPSWLDPTTPANLFDEDQEELEQRLALIVEGYPAALRPAVNKLGAAFADAVLALDEGKAEEALPILVGLPDDEPLVQWERARTAHALGDAPTAIRAVRHFAKIAGGHFPMGREHSGVYLAQLLAETGDLPGAVRVLREVRSSGEKPGTAGSFLFAQLLFATKELAEAEQVLTGLIRQHPGEAPLYTLLARVRLAGDHRTQAMRALEAGLEVCCAPGKCGAKPPDLELHRTLATLYLEEGTDRDRGLELAGTAASLVKQPTWEDAYLTALVARIRNQPEAPALATRLRELTPPEHPGAERITRYLEL